MINEIRNEIVKLAKAIVGGKFESEVIMLQESEVKISDKAIGAKVEQIMQDGTLEPLADGNYDLNGFVFEVKDGVIESIEGQEADEENSEEMAEEASIDEQPEESPLAQELADLKAEIEALKAEINEIKAAKGKEDANTEAMRKEFEKLNSTLEAFAKIPAEETKVNVREEFKKEKESKLNSFINGLKK